VLGVLVVLSLSDMRYMAKCSRILGILWYSYVELVASLTPPFTSRMSVPLPDPLHAQPDSDHFPPWRRPPQSREVDESHEGVSNLLAPYEPQPTSVCAEWVVELPREMGIGFARYPSLRGCALLLSFLRKGRMAATTRATPASVPMTQSATAGAFCDELAGIDVPVGVAVEGVG
jgi:hypothetical protein